MDIRNLSQEEYNAAIAAADLVCKTLNKTHGSPIVLPSDVQKQLGPQLTHCPYIHEVRYTPCPLNHYPNYQRNQPYVYPYVYPYPVICGTVTIPGASNQYLVN